MSVQVKTTDPKWEKPIKSTILERILFPYMKDERDLIFIRVTTLGVGGFAACLVCL